MDTGEQGVIEYFFGRTVVPGKTTSVGLMFRELCITNVALSGLAKGTTTLKGIIDGQEFIIAILSAKCPHVRVDLKFFKEQMFVSFEVSGENEVDMIGYVTGLDTTRMMSLKEAMQMDDASDDEEYKEPESNEEEEEEDNVVELDSETEEYKDLMIKEEEDLMEKDVSEEEEEEEEENTSEAIPEAIAIVSRDAVHFERDGYKNMGKFIRYKDMTIGNGPLPKRGHRVSVTYKMTLPTGEVIDNQNDEHIPRCPFPDQFRVGVGHVVNGVDRAIQTMRVGSVRNIIVSPEVGFGDKGNIVSDIRAGEIFSIEVNLLAAF